MAEKEKDQLEAYLTIREHMDHDKHWVGESLPAPTLADVAATIGSVTAAGSSKFPARADHTHELGLGVVTGTQIANEVVTSTKLADNAVTNAKVADNAIDTAELVNSAVTAAKIGTAAVTDVKLFNPKVNIAGDTMDGNLTVTAGSSPYCQLQAAGRIESLCNLVGNANLSVDRTLSTAIVAGQPFVGFLRSGTVIGSVTIATASTVAYNTSSDEDLKENIIQVPDIQALSILMSIEPVLFNWKIEPGTQCIGYIAQRVAAAWPMALTLGLVTPGRGTPGTPGYFPWCMDNTKIIPLLHSAIQALKRQFDAFKVQFDAFKVQSLAKVQQMEARLTALEAA